MEDSTAERIRSGRTLFVVLVMVAMKPGWYTRVPDNEGQPCDRQRAAAWDCGHGQLGTFATMIVTYVLYGSEHRSNLRHRRYCREALVNGQGQLRHAIYIERCFCNYDRSRSEICVVIMSISHPSKSQNEIRKEIRG